MVFDLFANLPLGEGFGINGNLLETNIVNLAVVVGVLVKYGGEIATQTLNDRKEKIVKSISDAEERYAEAQQKLQEAKQDIELAKQKAEEIKKQSFLTADQTVKAILKRAEQDIKRLEDSKQITLQLEEEKALNEVCGRVSRSALTKAKSTLLKLSDYSNFRKRILNFNISSF
jgi:F-type H+-transporting ATPase subunit b